MLKIANKKAQAGGGATSVKKEYSTNIHELKTFARPNLDDGNRFFDDNLGLISKFGPSMISKIQEAQEKETNFKFGTTVEKKPVHQNKVTL